MIKLDQISLPIKYSENDILSAICKKLKIKSDNIQKYEIVRLSIDARKKPNVKYVANIGVSLKNNLEDRFSNLRYEKTTRTLCYEKKSSKENIYVIGFGPSGIFASLALARMGLNPIIIEQGKMVEDREQDVLKFWNERKLNKFSNVQFGEGGAGTFSDGKLNTNLNNEYCKIVINELIAFGAPKEIGYIHNPHIGSDKLKKVVKNIREHIKSLGGKFMFSTRLVDIEVLDKTIKSITVENVETNDRQTFPADKVFLAVGHSAKDIFRLLYDKGVTLTQKPFAMGVRIEQKQADINKSQYGAEKIDGLPNADYKLVAHLPSGRSIFTFCMCPGGQVVASSSEEGEIVTNGMSYFARDKENANSAVLINVTPQDYGSEHPLAGIEFQSKYEKLAFELGGKNFNAPAESVGSFVYNKNIETDINCSYRPNITLCKIEKCLPDFVVAGLKEGLPLLNNKLKNFAKDENLLIAIESRSSCPLTIVRDENYESSVRGLYPLGEGAGYAGGIMSSAQDGIKVVESIYNKI
ncbi:MAG: hypothetical protein E7354_02545 [Clostridiales bacterium]|nr:hypothetical protein [Clostridiales bacterium]